MQGVLVSWMVLHSGWVEYTVVNVSAGMTEKQMDITLVRIKGFGVIRQEHIAKYRYIVNRNQSLRCDGITHRAIALL